MQTLKITFFQWSVNSTDIFTSFYCDWVFSDFAAFMFLLWSSSSTWKVWASHSWHIFSVRRSCFLSSVQRLCSQADSYFLIFFFLTTSWLSPKMRLCEFSIRLLYLTCCSLCKAKGAHQLCKTKNLLSVQVLYFFSKPLVVHL